MTLIPELREELFAMAVRKARRRRRWFFSVTPVALLATTTAALAAGGVISIGSPAKDPPALGVAKPDADNGVVVAGTNRVLALRVPDSDGGPAWGLRLYSTTRGLGCIAPGRVVNGRIGVYGRYGAFDDDGQLHPFPPDSLTGSFLDCTPLDAGGRLFLSVGAPAFTASASRLNDCAPRVGDKASGLCALDSERTLFYGTLGPQAKSITYTSPTGPKTVPTNGPEGAYLIVLPSSRNGSSEWGASRAPRAEAITEVAFRDGHTCTRTTTLCTLPGFHPLPLTIPTREAIGARVTATARQGRRFWVLRVKFRARVAIEDATAAYNVRIFPPSKTGRSATAVTHGNIKAGELVEQVFQHLNGGGEYRIVVGYHRAADPGTLPMGGKGVTVGRFRLKIP